jgi:type VI secretion system secreted protein VgrG
VHPRAEADKQAGGSAPSSSGSAVPRGQGFELRTDQWGAIRAAKGLLITTDGKSQAVGGALDRAELIACLSEALTLAKSLSGNAVTSDTSTEAGKPAYATSKDDHAAQDTQLTNIKGLNQSANDGANVTEQTAPHLSLFSPAGIASATPGSITSFSGSNSDTIAQRNLHSTSGQQTHLHAGTGIRAFAQSGGIHAIANQGKLLLQSQHDDTVVNAEQSIHMTATQQHVLIEAKQHITLVESGGAYLKIKDGLIEFGGPGSFTVKAASYKFAGPDHGEAALPTFVKGDVGRKFVAMFAGGTQIAALQAYKITMRDGTVHEGSTNAKGETDLVQNDQYNIMDIELKDKPESKS